LGPLVWDDDGGSLGTYSSVEFGFDASQTVWIGVMRGGGSPFGYYDISVAWIGP